VRNIAPRMASYSYSWVLNYNLSSV
jgi:hypothetical protein